MKINLDYNSITEGLIVALLAAIIIGIFTLIFIRRNSPLTAKRLERIIELERKDAIEQLPEVSDDKKPASLIKINELDRRLANPEKTFKEVQKLITNAKTVLKAILKRLGNEIKTNKLAKAQKILEKGDFLKADELLAEIEAHEKLTIQEFASLAFTRGEIAEYDIRWSDAVGHYARAVNLAPNFNTLIRAQTLANTMGDYSSALSFGLAAQKAAIAEYGENSEEYTRSLNRLASFYLTQGQGKKAEKLCKQALQIQEKIFEEPHHENASSLNILARFYETQLQYDKAEQLYQKSLDIHKKIFGEKNIATASSINNLAGVYEQQGRYDEAEPLYQKSIEIDNEIFGGTHPDTATSIHNLAGLYTKQNRYEEAESLYKKSLKIKEDVFGKKHLYTALTLNNLGEIYYKQGQYKDAELYFNEALDIYKEIQMEKHSYNALSLYNLAVLYKKTLRLKEADLLYKQTLEVLDVTLGPEHPDTKNVKIEYKHYKTILAIFQKSSEKNKLNLKPKKPHPNKNHT